MPVILSGVIFLFSAAGIAASVLLLKEKKIARVLCVVLCAAAAFLSAGFIALTLYFGWAVRNQEPSEPPDEIGTQVTGDSLGTERNDGPDSEIAT